MFWKRRSENILERTIGKSFFKGGRKSFSKMRRCRKKFVEVQEEVAKIKYTRRRDMASIEQKWVPCAVENPCFFRGFTFPITLCVARTHRPYHHNVF